MGAHTLTRIPSLSPAFSRNVSLGPAMSWEDIVRQTHAQTTKAELALYGSLTPAAHTQGMTVSQDQPPAAPPKSSPRSSRKIHTPPRQVA